MARSSTAAIPVDWKRFSITAEDVQMSQIHDVSQEARDDSGKWTKSGSGNPNAGTGEVPVSAESRQRSIDLCNKASERAARATGLDEFDVYIAAEKAGIDPSDYGNLIQFYDDMTRDHQYGPKAWEPPFEYHVNNFEPFEDETEEKAKERLGRYKAMTFVRTKFRQILVDSDIPNSQKKEYLKAVQDVIPWMPKEALYNLAHNVEDVRFYKSTKELSREVFPEDAVASVGGCWEPSGVRNQGILHLDGGSSRDLSLGAKAIYAHEFTHALDWYEDDDGESDSISNTDEWQDAFKSEIADKQLSDYAATVDYEGFAEFGRLLYGTGRNPKLIASEFPKCYAVFKKHGLVK